MERRSFAKGAGSPATPAGKAASTSTEELAGTAHIAPVLSYIADLEAAATNATTQVADVASNSGDAISPDLGGEERASTSGALAISRSNNGKCIARLAILRSEALGCVGIPVEQANRKLEAILDELIALADEIEQHRQVALQTIAEPHFAASSDDTVA